MTITLKKGWHRCRRKAALWQELECRQAKKTQTLSGNLWTRSVASKGDWIIRNPKTGYCWAVSQELFDDLYKVEKR